MLGCALLLCGASRSVAVEGLDPRQLGFDRQREVAARQLESARESVAIARAAVESSQRELDEFVAKHFEELRSLATEDPHSPPKASVSPPPHLNGAAQAKGEQLRRQIDELTTRRDQLLERLLPAHPEVVSIERQIEEYSAKLAARSADAEGRWSRRPSDSRDQAAEPFEAPHNRHQAAARLYDEYLERRSAAQQDLRDAVEAEELAQRRMAQIPLPSAQNSPIGLSNSAPAPAPSPSPAPHHASRQAEPPANAQRGSQPLALLALVIALAVAALAAVKLARSTSDTLFASVDEIAAALALPVVGVFPMPEPARLLGVPPVRSLRPWILAGQVTLAVILFALIAYCVQNPGALWQTLAHPLESLGRAISFLLGKS